MSGSDQCSEKHPYWCHPVMPKFSLQWSHLISMKSSNTLQLDNSQVNSMHQEHIACLHLHWNKSKWFISINASKWSQNPNHEISSRKLSQILFLEPDPWMSLWSHAMCTRRQICCQLMVHLNDSAVNLPTSPIHNWSRNQTAPLYSVFTTKTNQAFQVS